MECSTPSRPGRPVLGESAAQAVQLALVGHVELDDRRGLRAAAARSARPGASGQSGEHHLGALLLRHLRHVKSDRGVSDHACDQQSLAVEQSRHLSVLPPESMTHSQAAVDRQYRAGDVRRPRLKPGRSRPRRPPPRWLSGAAGPERGTRPGGRRWPRAVMSVSTKPGRDDVGGDRPGPQLTGDRTGRARSAPLCRRVVDLARRAGQRRPPRR